jgi:hypothetical protein
MRGMALVWLLAATFGGALPASAQQTEVDRLLVRVYGAVITQSDVRQARALKLVSDTGSDEATQRGLENRLLLLRELAGAASGQGPGDDAFAARRRMWEQAMGGDAGAQLSRYGMNEASINAWLRDDARIDAFLRQQFGEPGGSERERALSNWVDRLRQRAGLR